MKYLVRYHDLNPLDPQARFDFHREIVTADSPQEAAEIIANSGKEVIDVEDADLADETEKAALIAHNCKPQMSAFLEAVALAYDEEDGTQPSPIIQGGEIIETQPYHHTTEQEDETMPF